MSVKIPISVLESLLNDGYDRRTLDELFSRLDDKTRMQIFTQSPTLMQLQESSLGTGNKYILVSAEQVPVKFARNDPIATMSPRRPISPNLMRSTLGGTQSPGISGVPGIQYHSYTMYPQQK